MSKSNLAYMPPRGFEQEAPTFNDLVELVAGSTLNEEQLMTLWSQLSPDIRSELKRELRRRQVQLRITEESDPARHNIE